MSAGLTHLSLFSGIGGMDIAAERAGFVTVGQVELADYPYEVLCRHWPDVARWRDIRTLTKESFYERTGLSTVGIISGGFPCQPFSVAGKQKGKEDERYLWPEMLRVIRELRPRWVLGENVPGILRIAADDVCKDLECEGYSIGIFDFEAAAVGAPHRRERIFFVGNAKHNGLSAAALTRSLNTAGGEFAAREDKTGKFEGAGRPRNNEAMANTECQRLERYNVKSTAIQAKAPRADFRAKNGVYWRNQWAVEPNVGRVANGISARVDRVKCLGNAVVPQQVFPIFAAIAEIEKCSV